VFIKLNLFYPSIPTSAQSSSVKSGKMCVTLLMTKPIFSVGTNLVLVKLQSEFITESLTCPVCLEIRGVCTQVNKEFNILPFKGNYHLVNTLESVNNVNLDCGLGHVNAVALSFDSITS